MKHLVFILALLSANNASAYGPYDVDVIRVVDGDTLDLEVDLWSWTLPFPRSSTASPRRTSSGSC